MNNNNLNNFFNDNSDIVFHLSNMNLEQIISLKEKDFCEKNQYAWAPKDASDAKDNYEHILKIVGDISANIIAPYASEVDLEGATFKNGEVIYAKATTRSMNALKQADLMGFTIPRKYGGINMPKIIYTMAIEMISRADASLMNIFGLQEIA
ncbi:MAG: acyl-CoA dehydrogenase family protein, partial [Oligoflexia bacterium]|nr:acyl-CoA dehydrogenase family protein [Oligoflexia bacterium]